MDHSRSMKQEHYSGSEPGTAAAVCVAENSESVLAYLWRSRKRHEFGSKAWILSWTKRILALPALFGLCRRRNRLRRQGASIGNLAFVGAVKLIGPARRLQVGPKSFIGNAIIMPHGEVEVGRCAIVNDFVTLLTASHDVNDPTFPRIPAKITIGDYAWVAQGAMILPGVRIGRGAVVGAGAVVAKSVDDYAIVVGNPAKPIAKTRSVLALGYTGVDSLVAVDAWLHWSWKQRP